MKLRELKSFIFSKKAVSKTKSSEDLDSLLDTLSPYAAALLLFLMGYAVSMRCDDEDSKLGTNLLLIMTAKERVNMYFFIKNIEEDSELVETWIKELIDKKLIKIYVK